MNKTEIKLINGDKALVIENDKIQRFQFQMGQTF